MIHTIYYFTGTGNALWAARELSRNIPEAEVHSILSVSSRNLEKADILGLVFPVYMHRVPHIVADFVKRLPKTGYLYAAAVNAGDTGIVFSYLKKLLSPTQNHLSAGFSITTPSNYLPFGESVQGEKRAKLLDTAHAKIERISSIIRNQRSFFDKEASFFHTRIFPGAAYAAGYRYIPYLDKKFTVDSTCNSCRICEMICPVGNVVLEGGKPLWHRHCQLCFACINSCPQDAIQYGKKTRGLRRYINPEITLQDIINQKKE